MEDKKYLKYKIEVDFPGKDTTIFNNEISMDLLKELLTYMPMDDILHVITNTTNGFVSDYINSSLKEIKG